MDQPGRVTRLMQLDNSATKMRLFLEALNNLGITEGIKVEDGQSAGMFSSEVYTNPQVKQLMKEYSITGLGFSSTQPKTLSPNFINEGDTVKLRKTGERGIVVESTLGSTNSSLLIELKNGTTVYRGLHEVLKESLDAVGQEDEDINNDGEVNKTDSYLSTRRKVVSQELENMQDLNEVVMEAITLSNEFDQEEPAVVEIPDWDEIKRGTVNQERTYNQEENTYNFDEPTGGEKLDFSRFDDEMLIGFAEFSGMENAIQKDRSEIEAELNDFTLLTQQEVEEYFNNATGGSLDESIQKLAENEHITPKDFPFDPAIDFREATETLSFGENTPEYEILNLLPENEWYDYIDLLADADISISYNSQNDCFKVTSPSFDQLQEEEDEERYEIEEADQATFESITKSTGARLLECRGMLKSSGQKDKVEIIVEHLNNKKTIIYNDADDNKYKPWSIGYHQFKTINEAVQSIRYKKDDETLDSELKESIEYSKKKSQINKYASVTNPNMLIQEERERREKRSQELMDKFLDDDLLNRKLF